MILKNSGSKSKKWIRSLAIGITLAAVLMGSVAAYAASADVPSAAADEGTPITTPVGPIDPVDSVYPYEEGQQSISAPSYVPGEPPSTFTPERALEPGAQSKSAPSSEKDIQSITAPSHGTDRASWGYITLTWQGRDWAYATMSTYAGTAYYLYARVSGTDGLGSIPPQSNSNYGQSSVTTAKIFSRTTSSSVTWYGYGEIQDTSSSGTQTASTSVTV